MKRPICKRFPRIGDTVVFIRVYCGNRTFDRPCITLEVQEIDHRNVFGAIVANGRHPCNNSDDRPGAYFGIPWNPETCRRLVETDA